MLNKPKFLTPSTNRQECVVDVTSENIPFSCIIDGNESISAWRIKVYSTNDNTEVLDTGKQQLTSPFFPIDSRNNNVVFNVNLYDYNVLFGEKFINTKDAYYWTIEFWSTQDVANDQPTTISCEECFFANTTPDITIYYSKDNQNYYELSDGVVLGAMSYYFKADFTQVENVGLKRYGWRLRDVESSEVLLDTMTSNHIYGSADNILMSYDGFLNSDTYAIELYIETQNNAVVVTPPISFKIQYDVTYLTNEIAVQPLNEETAIMLSWEDSHIIAGKGIGQIAYKTNYPITSDDENSNSIHIGNNASIVFEYDANANLDIPEDTYMVFSMQMDDGIPRTLLSVEGYSNLGFEVARKLSFDGTSFIYNVQNASSIIQKTYTVTNTPSPYVWYIITLSPYLGVNGEDTWMRVVESVATNGLYPSDTLYPSASVRPSFGVWDKLKEVEV